MALPPRDEPPSLDDRIQGLPQELQDLIFDSVIYDNPRTFNRTQQYNPPLSLHVNRKTCDVFAKYHYYRNTRLITSDRELLERWLCSLPESHFDMLQVLAYDIEQSNWIHGAIFQRQEALRSSRKKILNTKQFTRANRSSCSTNLGSNGSSSLVQ